MAKNKKKPAAKAKKEKKPAKKKLVAKAKSAPKKAAKKAAPKKEKAGKKLSAGAALAEDMDRADGSELGEGEEQFTESLEEELTELSDDLGKEDSELDSFDDDDYGPPSDDDPADEEGYF